MQQVATGGAATAPAARPLTAPQPAQGNRGFPAWAIVLLAVLGAVVLLIAIAVPMKAGQDEKYREATVKEGIHSIHIAIQSWAVDNNDAYPDPSVVSFGGLGTQGYIDYWPANPYTRAPMALGTGPGDFAYALSADGKSFTLVGYGKGSKVLIRVP